MYVLIITAVIFVVWLAVALHSAPDFEQATGYAPQCFTCNKGDCDGCKHINYRKEC